MTAGRATAGRPALRAFLLGLALLAGTGSEINAAGTSLPASSNPPPSAQNQKTSNKSKAVATPPMHPHNVIEPISPKLAGGILGAKVKGPDGEDMGLVVDIVVDRDGRPRALVIDFGGFLGVGSRKIAIDWRLVHYKPGDKAAPVLVMVSRGDLQSAPEYDPTSATNKMVGPAVVKHPAPTDAGN